MLHEVDDDDKDFYLKLEEKRHKEILNSLSSLIKVIQNDDALKTVVHQQEAAVKKIVDTIGKLPAPEVIVENKEVINSLDEVVKSLQQLKDVVNKNAVREWEFDIVRKSSGYIEKIKVKAI